MSRAVPRTFRWLRRWSPQFVARHVHLAHLTCPSNCGCRICGMGLAAQIWDHMNEILAKLHDLDFRKCATLHVAVCPSPIQSERHCCGRWSQAVCSARKEPTCVAGSAFRTTAKSTASMHRARRVAAGLPNLWERTACRALGPAQERRRNVQSMVRPWHWIG